jgi:hypothetical protein
MEGRFARDKDSAGCIGFTGRVGEIVLNVSN